MSLQGMAVPDWTPWLLLSALPSFCRDGSHWTICKTEASLHTKVLFAAPAMFYCSLLF